MVHLRHSNERPYAVSSRTVSQLRLNPLTGRWVTIVSSRAERPTDFAPRDISVDADPSLAEALAARAGAEQLAVHAVCADVRALELDRDFGLIIAPMQLLQMLGGQAQRRPALERAAGHLAPAGRVAAAIVESAAAGLDGGAAALPDVRERDGWVYTSIPVAVGTNEGGARRGVSVAQGSGRPASAVTSAPHSWV